MYDTGGGANLGTTANDAHWIAADGFQDTGYFLESTAPALYYRVYKRTYYRGDLVQLQGNRQGVTDPSITSNYWLLMKRATVTFNEPPAALCVAAPDVTQPKPLANIRAVPGATSVTLVWENPNDLDFAGVVIRRDVNGPPGIITDGTAPTGVVVTPQSFKDTSASVGTTYFYTVFALDGNNLTTGGVSVATATSPDSDGDSVADSYESTTLYRGSFHSDPLNPDTDGDGVTDGDEIALGTDPTNPDVSKPVVNAFWMANGPVVLEPSIEFILDATDDLYAGADVGITGWMINENPDPPLGTDSRWQPPLPFWPIPITYTLLPGRGEHTVYVWVKDAAGNVNAPSAYSAITLNF
jgi:hypothetical protein